jgi:hypothetical protein
MRWSIPKHLQHLDQKPRTIAGFDEERNTAQPPSVIFPSPSRGKERFSGAEEA